MLLYESLHGFRLQVFFCLDFYRIDIGIHLYCEPPLPPSAAKEGEYLEKIKVAV